MLKTTAGRQHSSRAGWIHAIAFSAAFACAALPFSRVAAQTPESGTISASATAPVEWDGAASGLPPADAEASCEEDTNCETYQLTVAGSPADWNGKLARVTISWTIPATDYDLYIHKGAADGPVVGQSATSPPASAETVAIDPNDPAVGTGVFFVHVIYFGAVGAVDQYHGTAVTEVKAGSAAPAAAAPTPASSIGSPRYTTHYAPPGVGEDAGEPTVGVNWNTEQVFSNSNGPIPNGGTSNYYGGFLPYMLKVTFDDCSSPARAIWEQKPVTLPNLPRAFGDPILFTDNQTGRTFVAQELGLTPGGSTTEFTDNDGDSFTPSTGSGAPSGIDHETIGGGRYHDPIPDGANPLYPHAVYYASQSIADAAISLSVDGGITFLPSTPMYTAADCAGLHGHIKVSPADGTVYVPNRACGGSIPFHDGGQTAAVVSEDNGLTWSVRPVQGSTTRNDRDPSIGVATDGTVYIGWQAGDGHAHVAVSKDKGVTWSAPLDVGIQAGVKNIVFPAVVAGDPDRAAFAYYGTETAGDNYDAPDFPGVWYLYVSTTYDGGKTWTTTNVTPNDPIQRGGICGDGTCRNLLDFFDADVDKQGRVVIGWDDGCIGSCVSGPPNSFTAKAVISRQSGGKRMFAQYDPVEPAIPQAPSLEGSVNPANTVITLSWPEPDNGGSPITAYRVFRSTTGESGAFTLLATVTERFYEDRNFDPAAQNFYRVTAINALGEGPFCEQFHPTAIEVPNVCATPGALVINDLNPDGSDADSGANTPLDSSVNIKQLFVAEPFAGENVNQVVFTLQVGAPPTTGSAPPSSQWFILWNREQTADDGSDRMYVAMRSDLSGAVSFEYGNFGPPLDPLNPNPTANTPIPLGTPESGNYDPATGVITITIANSKIENKQPGKDFTGLNVRTYLARPDPGQRSQNNASDITGDASYTLRGNAACILNAAPIAQLTATPTTGAPPLQVTFDGSGSTDPDAGDSIASYTFSFGDGTPDVTQPSPTVTHTYTRGGSFFAALQVTDSHGLVSANVPKVPIVTTARLRNLSTRANVQTGDNVLISGFIVTGNAPKKVVLRGIGPSLESQNVSGTLQDPVLSLFDGNGIQIASNDNWKENEAEVQQTGLAPADDRESALVRTLNPGLYSAVVAGRDDSTGIALAEVYDIDLDADSRLANLSTRALVQTGDNVLIGGFIAGPTNAGGARVVARAIAPSLKDRVPSALDDPTIEVRDNNGTLLDANDNWRQSKDASEIEATGVAPTNDAESAILLPALAPGAYTAIVRGKGDASGVALVELYDIE